MHPTTFDKSFEFDGISELSGFRQWSVPDWQSDVPDGMDLHAIGSSTFTENLSELRIMYYRDGLGSRTLRTSDDATPVTFSEIFEALDDILKQDLTDEEKRVIVGDHGNVEVNTRYDAYKLMLKDLWSGTVPTTARVHGISRVDDAENIWCAWTYSRQ